MREDGFDQGMIDEIGRDRGGLAGRDDEIQIAHEFFFAPVAAGDLHEGDARMTA